MVGGYWPTVLGGLAVLGASLALSARPVAAQTRFTWPDTAVDVTRYASADQCVAATRRVQFMIASTRDWQASPDTMPWNPQAPLEPLPAPALTTAQHCATRFDLATAKLTDFAPLFALYLAADRDPDATALLTRRLAAVDSTHRDAERTAVIDSVVHMYMQAQPVRLAAAESLLTTRARHTTDRVARLKIYFQLMQQAGRANDTARVRRAAQQIVTIADSLTPAERETEVFESGDGKLAVYLAMLEVTGKRVLLDSLGRSTTAYVGLMRALWRRATGMRAGAMELPIGERAAPITADFWFPRDSAGPPRPTPGRVALVVFLDRQTCVDGPQIPGFASTEQADERAPCWQAGANLRRLAARFPALQITVVAPTRGYFVYAPPMPSEQEAAFVARWMAGHRIPGTLAVTSTPFWHLEAPDDRRIDTPDSNTVHYSFGKTWQAEGGVYLVDSDGVIVDTTGIAGLWGPWIAPLSQKIDILLHRNEGRGSHAGF